MVKIVKNLPIPNEPTELPVATGTVWAKRNQIILWVSVAHPGVESVPASIPRFPAVLDTGCNFNALIHKHQLRQWTDYFLRWYTSWVERSPTPIRIINSLEEKTQCPTYGASLWIYRSNNSAARPHRVQLSPGMVVVPSTVIAPRRPWPPLPLIGMQALQNANACISMKLKSEPGVGRVTIRAAAKFWPFRSP